MIIYPAIDIKDKKCVRLKQGKAEDSTIFFDNPIDAALQWVNRGSNAIHVVDLDGAFKGEYCNLDIIKDLKLKTGAFVQMGGGIRDKAAIENSIGNGIDRVIIGSAAINNIDLVEWAVKNFNEKIAVSIDCKNRKVAYNGWTGVSDIDVISLVNTLTNIGVKTIIYTDISKDGMMKGPDIEGINEIIDTTDVNIIASGGVTTINDVKELKNLGVYGVIIGRALYDGTIKVEEALEVAGCF